jgi:hypothetical protein
VCVGRKQWENGASLGLKYIDKKAKNIYIKNRKIQHKKLQGKAIQYNKPCRLGWECSSVVDCMLSM